MGFLDKLLGRGKPAAEHTDEAEREREAAEEAPAQDEWAAPEAPSTSPSTEQ